MIGILIVAHDPLGDSLVRAVTHVLGQRPPMFEAFPVAATDDPILLLPKARETVARLDTGDGVLIFSDIYGATPCNLACKLLVPLRVEGIAGVNLPMLIRALTYLDDADLADLLEKSRSGAVEGVVRMEMRS